MGNSLDKSDGGAPVQIMCYLEPQYNKDYRTLSYRLTKRLGNEAWPVGGTWNVETIKKAEMLIWEKDAGKKWKKRIKEWREEAHRKAEDARSRSWMNNACKKGIEIHDKEGKLKEWKVLEAECKWIEEKEKREKESNGTSKENPRKQLVNKKREEKPQASSVSGDPMFGITTLTISDNEEEEDDGLRGRPPPYAPVQANVGPLPGAQGLSLHPNISNDGEGDLSPFPSMTPAEEVKIHPRPRHQPDRLQMFPLRTVPNPQAGQGNQPLTVEIYSPWKPQELCLIRDKAPNKTASPDAFVDYLRSTVEYYSANDRDLWGLTMSLLTVAEKTKWKNAMNLQTWEAVKNVPAHREDVGIPLCINFMMEHLTNCLKQPINMSKVIDCKPAPREDPQTYFDRFVETYKTHAGDSAFNRGENSAPFNSILMSCLPYKQQTMIKTNLNWAENDLNQMRRAVVTFWPEATGKGPGGAGGMGMGIKNEYVLREDDLAPEGQVYALRPQYPGGKERGGPGRPFGNTGQREWDWNKNRNNRCFRCGREGHWMRDCPARRGPGPEARRTPYSDHNPFRQ